MNKHNRVNNKPEKSNNMVTENEKSNLLIIKYNNTDVKNIKRFLKR